VIVTDYAQDHVVEGDEQANKQALKAAHARAAQYYLQRAATSCPPREQRRQISDVHDLIEAIWQYCQADQWQEAYDLMEREGIFKDLNLWGGNAILLELYQLLLPVDKWQLKGLQTARIYYHLGWIYDDLGNKQEALSCYQQALSISREVGDRRGEGVTLWNIGALHFKQGCYDVALVFFLIAKSIFEEIQSPYRDRVQG
jgi:tetratricopeptide (TPR) repeat protein